MSRSLQKSFYKFLENIEKSSKNHCTLFTPFSQELIQQTFMSIHTTVVSAILKLLHNSRLFFLLSKITADVDEILIVQTVDIQTVARKILMI